MVNENRRMVVTMFVFSIYVTITDSGIVKIPSANYRPVQ